MRESGALDTWVGNSFAALCTTFYLSAGTFPAFLFLLSVTESIRATVAAFVVRTKAEDRMLEEHFGGEWRAWAEKVPYRLIPYIY